MCEYCDHLKDILNENIFTFHIICHLKYLCSFCLYMYCYILLFFLEKKLYLCVKLYRKLSCKIVLVGYNIFSFQRKKNQKNLFFLQIIDIYMYMWYTSDKIKIFNMKSFYLTPSKQIFGGEGNNRNYLVCLSLRQSLKSCPVQIFLIEKKIGSLEVLTSHNRLLMTWMCLITLTQGHKFKVTGRKSAYFLSSLYLFHWETFKSSYFIKKIYYGLRM